MRDLIGYTLYSLVGLVGIVLVYSIFSDAESETQIDQLSGEINTFINEMRKTHRGHPDRYGNGPIDTGDLIQSGIAPQTTVLNATTVRNSFGGAIEVRGINNNDFAIDNADVPQDVCIQLLTRMQSDNRMVGADVAATIATLSSTNLLELPLTLADANDQCAAATNAIRIQAR